MIQTRSGSREQQWRETRRTGTPSPDQPDAHTQLDAPMVLWPRSIEIRNPKVEIRKKIETRNPKCGRLVFVEGLAFELPSDFEFRISDFGYLPPPDFSMPV